MRRLFLTIALTLSLGSACTPAPTPVPSLIAQVIPTATVTPAPSATQNPLFAATYARGLSDNNPAIINVSPVSTWGYPLEIASLPQPTPTEALLLPPATLGDIPAMARRLMSTPLLFQMDTSNVRAIFARGQQMNMRADVFAVVGDSNSTNGDFLVPFGSIIETCDYGEFDYLRDTVNYFRAPIDGTTQNAFTFDSAAAEEGFTSASVFDPLWASPQMCAAGESPLSCEFRRIRPGIAVIMLGGRDVQEMSTSAYAANMTRLVEQSAVSGVIPILTTFVVLPERDIYPRSLEFNMMLLDIAELYEIPVINLWAAAQALPDVGIGPDRSHLRANIGSFCDFTGAQQQYGGTLRNLLTLQALDTIRRAVIFS